MDVPFDMNGPDPRNDCCWLTMPQTLTTSNDLLCNDCQDRKVRLQACTGLVWAK
jgi:hypothetical protein